MKDKGRLAPFVWHAPTRQSTIFTYVSFEAFRRSQASLGRSWGIGQCQTSAAVLRFLLRPKTPLQNLIDLERKRIQAPYAAVHVRAPC